jgi:hypothetical protein
VPYATISQRLTLAPRYDKIPDLLRPRPTENGDICSLSHDGISRWPMRRGIQPVSEYNVHEIIKPRSSFAIKFSLQPDK